MAEGATAEKLPVDELDDELAKAKKRKGGATEGAPEGDGAAEEARRQWSLWKKIHWIQTELEAIPKDGMLDVGSGKKVPVLSHNAMVAAIRPMFGRIGLVLVSTVTEYEVDWSLVQNKKGETYSAQSHKLRKHYTLVNVDGPEERFEFDGYGTSTTPTDKGYGAAESYCKKYALRSLFLVETGDDPDLGENVDMKEPRARQEQQERQEPTEAKVAVPDPVLNSQVHPAAQEIPDEAWREVADAWHTRGGISGKQVGRLMTIARKARGWDDTTVGSVLKHHLGLTSGKQIPYQEPYEKIVAIFETFPPSGDAADDEGRDAGQDEINY